MELQEIAEKTRLPLRKLRYVIDHRILPGLRVKIDESAVGGPRYFTELEGFAIACATTMLIGGLKREAVILCMDGLAELTWEGALYSKRPGSNQQEQAKKMRELCFYSSFYGDGSATAMLADGENLRVQVKQRDTGWRQPKTLVRLDDDYKPVVILQLDLAQIRTQMQEHP
jgi:hypothetical protein